jgi:predicted nuclease with TOPRIM domain
MPRTAKVKEPVQEPVQEETPLLEKTPEVEIEPEVKPVKVKRVRSEKQIEAQKNNKWLVHLKEYREQHPELSYKAAMIQAAPAWNEKKNIKVE